MTTTHNPSAILSRRRVGRQTAEQAVIILANLDQVADDLVAPARSVYGSVALILSH
jgi:hypothetical protein